MTKKACYHEFLSNLKSIECRHIGLTNILKELFSQEQRAKRLVDIFKMWTSKIFGMTCFSGWGMVVMRIIETGVRKKYHSKSHWTPWPSTKPNSMGCLDSLGCVVWLLMVNGEFFVTLFCSTTLVCYLAVVELKVRLVLLEDWSVLSYLSYRDTETLAPSREVDILSLFEDEEDL